jgi:hypothetical protein
MFVRFILILISYLQVGLPSVISSVEILWSKYSIHFSFLRACCMYRPSYSSRIKHPGIVRWRIQIVKNSIICSSSILKHGIRLCIVDWKSFLPFTPYDMQYNFLLIRSVGNAESYYVSALVIIPSHDAVRQRVTPRGLITVNCSVDLIYRLAAGCACFCTVLVFHRNTRLFLFVSPCKWNNMHSVTKWCSLIATVFYSLFLSRDLTMHHYPNVGVSEKDR